MDDRARREDLGRDVFLARVDGIIDPAYRLATVMVLDYEAAEDAVHDAAVRAWSQYRKLRGDITSFRTWFLGIVAAECLRSRPLRMGRRGVNPAAPTALRDILAGVPVASRAALFCHVALDFPMEEVARILDMPHSRVRSRVYHAREHVEDALRRQEDEG